MARLLAWAKTIDTAALAAWVEAIGTLLAVIAALSIALFQDKMRSWVMKPKLDVSAMTRPPDCVKTSLVRQGADGQKLAEADTYYFRLRVSNEGNEKAELVEVFAAKLLKLQADGRFKEVDTFLPMNLVWSHYRQSFVRTISPDMYRHCDLAHVIDPQKRRQFSGEDKAWPNVPAEETVLSFDTVVRPHTLSYLVPSGKYHLEVLVAAANAKPVKKVVEITLEGTWYPDERGMFETGIGVRVI